MPIPRGAQLPEWPPVHPGEVLLEEFLRPLEMSQTEAAQKMAMPLNWLNLQGAVDLYQAEQDRVRKRSRPPQASRP